SPGRGMEWPQQTQKVAQGPGRGSVAPGEVGQEAEVIGREGVPGFHVHDPVLVDAAVRVDQDAVQTRQANPVSCSIPHRAPDERLYRPLGARLSPWRLPAVGNR